MTQLTLHFKGDKFDLVDAVATAPMQTLKVLNLASQLSGEGERQQAVTPKTINATITKIFTLGAQGDFNTIDLLDDLEIIQNLQGIVFLIRRGRGEQITFDEAGDFNITELSIEIEADEAAAAPKDLADQQPTEQPQT